jgi:hypothetical protein
MASEEVWISLTQKLLLENQVKNVPLCIFNKIQLVSRKCSNREWKPITFMEKLKIAPFHEMYQKENLCGFRRNQLVMKLGPAVPNRFRYVTIWLPDDFSLFIYWRKFETKQFSLEFFHLLSTPLIIFSLNLNVLVLLEWFSLKWKATNVFLIIYILNE